MPKNVRSGGCLETSRSDYSVTQLVIPEERNVQVHRFDNHITRKIAYNKKISCRTWLHDHILSLGNVAEHKHFCFRLISTGCPTRYRTRHVFNNFTVSQQLGARQTHTLQTHSSSFLTQRTYPCSNFVAVSSLVLELLTKCRVRLRVGHSVFSIAVYCHVRHCNDN
jgi:hypothetical protein